jgi:hypothetical protein
VIIELDHFMPFDPLTETYVRSAARVLRAKGLEFDSKQLNAQDAPADRPGLFSGCLGAVPKGMLVFTLGEVAVEQCVEADEVRAGERPARPSID